MKIQLLSAAFAVCALSLGACSQTADTPASVAVTDAWCRPTPPAAPVAGCYLTLTASGADRLVSVESPAAERTEIHSMSMENGVMHMAKLEDGLDLPAGTAVTLRPGAEHLMLIGPKQPLSEGDMVDLILTFEKAPGAKVSAQVKAVPPGA